MIAFWPIGFTSRVASLTRSLPLSVPYLGPWMKSIVRLAHVQVGNVRIDFSCRNVCVAQHRLHGSRVRAVLHQLRSKTMTQRVRQDDRDQGLGSMIRSVSYQ